MPIQVSQLSHRYKRELALDHVDLWVRDGDRYGFIGANGAGKTTTLRSMLGLLSPESGDVRIDGHDPVAQPRVRAIVGGLIETAKFHDHRTGRANLLHFALLRGIAARERTAEVDRVLGLVGLEHAANKRVGQYSQGMGQRLGLALALLGSPRYLVLDEPTNGLDPQGIHELRELLDEIARTSGITILLSSHLLTEVAGLCNRIGVLHEGRMLTEAPASELLTSARLHRVQTDDDERVLDYLRERDLDARPADDGVHVDLGGEEATALLADLVGAGHRVHVFAPHESSLEDIYLALTRGERAHQAAAETEGDAPATPSDSIPGLSAASAIARIARYECRRLLRPRTLAVLAIPALLAPLIVYQRYLGLALASSEVDDGALASTTDVTAFEGLARALVSAVPLLALVVAGLASQSVAGELHGGTLRHVVTGPFRRAEVALGKLAVLLGTTLFGYALLLASAATAAGYAFDYGDLVELLATGEPFPHLKAEDVWPELWPALGSPILPLLALTALGFLCGTLARTGTGALALTLGTITGCELIRAFARSQDLEGALLGPYIPSPFSRASHLDYFVDVAGGVSRQPMEVAFTTPVIWLSTCAVFAAMILRRKYVP